MECLLILVLAVGGGLTGGVGPDPDVEVTSFLDRLLYNAEWEEDPAFSLGVETRVPTSTGPEPLFDFDRLELTPFVGMVLYSSEWEADPALCYGVRAQVPTPGIMEDLGAYVQISVSELDRDIPTLAQQDDRVFFASIGADYTILDGGGRFRAHAQTALLYGNFGAVSETNDGISLVLGVLAEWRITKSVSISYNPQFALADDSEWLFFHHLGITIPF